jgi:acetyl-CoA carboxylase carboxyltransferase component
MYAGDKDADVSEKAAEFEKQSGTEAAAARGYIDSIIEPASARKQLIFAFEILFTKSEYPIGKKHGTI